MTRSRVCRSSGRGDSLSTRQALVLRIREIENGMAQWGWLSDSLADFAGIFPGRGKAHSLLVRSCVKVLIGIALRLVSHPAGTSLDAVVIDVTAEEVRHA
ncbi:MAG: hypothetical protein AAGU21_14250 [Solidesulfovibrio sp.]|uniref:hypothetical protein n=1 Tax=Solidesulfovibrio sp. TaxID=2910990 RepID=UPI002B1FDD28|nr:hypothetical protein [Solidesulfovibrio sp.]MEA4856117.1 hypothetical protein [Solidesulfovibrio sp.]